MQYTYNMYVTKFCTISMSCISPDSHVKYRYLVMIQRPAANRKPMTQSGVIFLQGSLSLGEAVADVLFRAKQIAIIHAELSPVRNLRMSHRSLQVEVPDEG